VDVANGLSDRVWTIKELIEKAAQRYGQLFISVLAMCVFHRAVLVLLHIGSTTGKSQVAVSRVVLVRSGGLFGERNRLDCDTIWIVATGRVSQP
jgi:hypothetical protein